MHVITFVVFAMALGISVMMLMHRCADAVPISLPSGLLVSVTLAMVHVVLFCLGMLIGNVFRFESVVDPEEFSRSNAFVCFGLALIVAVKQIWPYLGRKTAPLSYEINTGTVRVFFFTVATGINGFLLAIGVGFVLPLVDYFHAVVWIFLAFFFVFSYLGIMFGRQHIVLRPRRWMLLSSVMIFVIAIAMLIRG